LDFHDPEVNSFCSYAFQQEPQKHKKNLKVPLEEPDHSGIGIFGKIFSDKTAV
jgi:hypothetical protein